MCSIMTLRVLRLGIGTLCLKGTLCFIRTLRQCGYFVCDKNGIVNYLANMSQSFKHATHQMFLYWNPQASFNMFQCELSIQSC